MQAEFALSNVKKAPFELLTARSAHLTDGKRETCVRFRMSAPAMTYRRRGRIARKEGTGAIGCQVSIRILIDRSMLPDHGTRAS